MAAYFYTLAIIGCALAYWKGSRSEKFAAMIYIAGSITTTLAGTASQWALFEPKIFLIDCLILVGFWMIALRSKKFWPYWITGWQLVGVLIHVQKAFLPGIAPEPYGYLSMYLSIPVLILIVIAGITDKKLVKETISIAQMLQPDGDILKGRHRGQ